MTQILLVMKGPGNIRVLTEALEKAGYSVVSASDEDTLADLLAQRPPTPGIGLVDTQGFGSTVWKLCEMLQNHNRRFVVLSGAGEMKRNGRVFGMGAAGMLQKPVGKSALLQLLNGMTS